MYWLNAQPSIFISVIRSPNDYSHVVQLLLFSKRMNVNAVVLEKKAKRIFRMNPSSKCQTTHLPIIWWVINRLLSINGTFCFKYVWKTEHLHGHLTFPDYNVHITCWCPKIWKQMLVGCKQAAEKLCDTNVENDQSQILGYFWVKCWLRTFMCVRMSSDKCEWHFQ